MAYVNVAEWKTDQVCEWLKGLDNSAQPYVHSFTNHGVNGQQLLNLRSEDLEHLGVLKLGHQEVILEAVEYLRNFHYELDRENLQLLALHLSCQAHSLHNELSRQSDTRPVTTQTLSDVASVVMAVKPLVRWLDRPPFTGQLEYNDKKVELMKLSLEMATCAQRDRFAERPIEEIRTTCEQLAKLADYIIQDIADPMILQPASLDLATLKKRPGDELGFYILPSFHGTHQIAEIKFGSIAHQCGKMEEGDEIVQVNYQTVVGWERKNVLELFRESPSEVLLTLKRRPRHTKVYGQIYIKPYRLPSNKKTPYATRWQHNLPSPRPELLTIPDFTMPLPRHTPKDPSPEPVMTTDSSDSDCEVDPPLSVRLYSTKPRNVVQRRATITGASPTTKHGIDIEQFWQELKEEHSTTFQLRDKAASCAHGLDAVTSTNLRPQTCLGIEQSKLKKRIEGKDEEKQNDGRTVADEIEGNAQEDQKSDKMVQISVNHSSPIAKTNLCNSIVQSNENVRSANNHATGQHGEGKSLPKERGRLDKSYSTPAYDFSETNNNDFLENKITSVDSSLNSTEIIDTSDKAIVRGAVAQKINEFEKSSRNVDVDVKLHSSKAFENNNFTQSPGSVRVDLVNERNGEKEQCVASTIDCDPLPDVTNRRESKSSSSGVMITDCDGQASGSSPDVPVGIYTASRESSEDKSESTSSYMEGICSSGSEGGANLQTFDDVSLLVDNASLDKNKIGEGTGKETDAGTSSQILVCGSGKVANNRDATANKGNATKLSSNVTPQRHKAVRSESNTKLTPPEPPPRRYISKPAPLHLKHDSSNYDDEEKPKIPERSTTKRDLRKVIEHRDNPVYHRKSDNFETYSDFVEKSTDFIDESNDVIAFTDSCGYSEIRESHPKESKSVQEKYEPFVQKFGIHHPSETAKLDRDVAPHTDSLDGVGHSQQSQSHVTDLKLQTLERDKGFDRSVVNRAMMVARSIGLHGTGSKPSNGSPSGRRRNDLLAKRRNVSVKDVGAGELEGWLTYRSRGAGGAWARAWFILKGSFLYRFKNTGSAKADCLIALTGFTASQATEVKSRKYAFKVYHTGTVFYFAADTEDSMIIWLDAIEKATLKTDNQNRSSGLFSETDESDGESKVKSKSVSESRLGTEKSFGSLKKIGRKESSFKESDVGGASLDRKYLRFLGARNQNVPVPTAQFRSYRRVLPVSTPTKRQECTSGSPDLQVTVAGSTFYGLSSPQSSHDVSSNSKDMSDYRQTTERSQSTRRSDDLMGFVTLEEFMLSNQGEEGSLSSHSTPLTGDHVRVSHNNLEETPHGRWYNNELASNSFHNISSTYGQTGTANCTCPPTRSGSNTYGEIGQRECNTVERPRTRTSAQKSSWELSCVNKRKPKEPDSNHWDNEGEPEYYHVDSPNYANGQHNVRLDLVRDVYSQQTLFKNETDLYHTKGHGVRNLMLGLQLTARGYSGSSGDLTSQTADSLQYVRKETAKVTRKGSFNLPQRGREYASSSERNWMDSLRRSDRKNVYATKNRLKSVAQYQPPPIPNSPLERDGMRAAFEMHLDKGEQLHKTNRLKSFFGTKGVQKPNNLDLSKEPQKTLLGSPRLHRALFRDKCGSQHSKSGTRSGSQSPGDSAIGQSLSSFGGTSQSQTLSQSFSSVSSVSDWSPDTPTSNIPCSVGHGSCQKGHLYSGRNTLSPPTLPHIPPPISPPPDYPGLEYPPVFEPETYSLSDASLLRNRSRNNQNIDQQ